MKDKKAKTVLHGFIDTGNKSKCKPTKLWVDQGRSLYNNLMQKWLDDNVVLMCSNHNEDKSVVAEGFIRNLKRKIYKKMTANDSQFHLGYLSKTSR